MGLKIEPITYPYNYIRNFYSGSKSSYYFEILKNNIQWEHERLFIFGKENTLKRKVAWYGDPESVYSYSKKIMKPHPWIFFLTDIRKKIQNKLNKNFNSVLLNYYPDGGSGMGWHSDNEKELGLEPVIASISFGADRDFLFRNKVDKNKTINLKLENGSLLIMNPGCQDNWAHSLPKRRKIKSPRINLTFRYIM